MAKPWRQAAQSPTARPAARLGDWGATTYTEDGETLVIAMEAQTCLTLVFPYGERDAFTNRFFQALTWALEDLLNVQHVVTSELVPVTPLTLARLEDPRLREALRTAEFICGIERMYHDDLRRVQRNLNQFPHDCPPDYVPADAVRRLFGRPPVRFV